MLINYDNGTSRSGLIVGLTGDVMRVAIAGDEDLREFRLVADKWISDDCEVVSFEFPPGMGQHDDFRNEVAKAVRPMERICGYISKEETTTGTVH